MYPVITENETVHVTEQYFTMSDGVGLYTRIAVPKGKKKAPIVFFRTPYEKAHEGVPHDISLYSGNPFLKRGFAVIHQHCRGKGDSEGVCVPYVEREDGLRSLEIIRSLDIYDKEIYLCGASYLATVHLSHLDAWQDDIKAAALSIQTDRMYFRNYRNGCCYAFCNLNWWLNMISREYPTQNLEGALKRPYKDIMQRVLGEEYPPYTDMLLNDQYNDFWKNDPRTNVMDNLKIPVLLTEGWYDFYLEGMFSMWERLPKATKEKSLMLVGPWGHSVSVSQSAEYPLENGNIPEDHTAEWFDCIRSGRPYPYGKTGQVNYYGIGRGTWQAGEYPISDPKTMRLYFGKENLLEDAPCQTGESISYTYDPEKPVSCFPYKNIYKAASVGSVDGVLSFQTRAFAEDQNFFGKIRWHMPVRSDCEDTAFFIRVYFVEDDVAYNLTETITSLSHINENYVAGQTEIIDLETPPIAFGVKKGGKIRVDISSHGGIYVPHANVKGQWAEVSETKIANNTVFLQDAFLELNLA